MEPAQVTVLDLPRRPKVYSLAGITMSSALASCFAGAFLLSRNLRRLGKPREARQALLFGLVSIVVLVVLILAIEVPPPLEALARLLFEGLQVSAMYFYAKRVIDAELREHQAQGGQFFSNWRAVGFSIPLALIPLSFAIVVTMLFPDAPGVSKDEFLYSAQQSDNPNFQQMGAVSWDRFQDELKNHQWTFELRRAIQTNDYCPGMCAYNQRLNKFLTVQMVGPIDTPKFYVSYGRIGDEEGCRVVQYKGIDQVLPIYRNFFNRKIADIDTVFENRGVVHRDLFKLQEVPSK